MTNPYAPPRAAVEDIADPAAGVQLADRGTRLGASILDGLIFGLMVYLPFLAAAAFSVLPQGSQREPDFGPGLQIGLGIALIGFVVWLGLNIKLMKANGQSIGKKACGIKVTRRDGSPVSLSRLFWLRNVLNGLIGWSRSTASSTRCSSSVKRGAACTITLPTPSSSRRDRRPQSRRDPRHRGHGGDARRHPAGAAAGWPDRAVLCLRARRADPAGHHVRGRDRADRSSAASASRSG